MVSLLIVTGPPGSGKSTISAMLVARLSPSVLVEGDRFFGFLAEGAIEPWLPESHLQNGIVTEAAAAATGRFAEDYDTIYDGVVGPWLLSTFASATGLVELDYVILLPPADVCVARVRGRTGHGFSDEAATRRMHAEFDGASIDRRHVLPGGSAGPEETVSDIEQARAEGQLRYVAGA
ncbi:MAG: ATP-binding protein [Actinomycetia bacterium]|nr:ATP-binding protein [Actinomycetes bacterium]